jgi:type I restriction enzyme R subunit
MEQNIKEALKLYCEGGEDSGAIVGSIDENLDLANDLYKKIECIFTNAKIQNFMSLPVMDADCQKFRSLFKQLAQTINGMKLQGMNWKSDTDPYVQKLNVCNKWIDGKTRQFDILRMRYTDLMPARSEIQNVSTGKLGYYLTANLSEMEQDKIDADYLEEHFKQIIPTLVGDFSELEKQATINEFTTQMATLSAEQQKYAMIILTDIKDNKLQVNNKTLRELITEYQTEAENKAILDFAKTYGLDITILRKIYHVNGNHDIEISKLLDSCDRKSAESAFDCKWFTARAKLNNAIRSFI